MSTTVTFGTKLSVPDFKTKHNCSKLDIVKNPKNGKLFVSANGASVASVSKNYDASKDKEFVELIAPEGDIIWVLHNPSDANVIESL